MSWPFTLSPLTDAPVGLGEIRLDARPPYRGKAARLFVHDMDRDGAVVKWIVMNLRPPMVIYLQAPEGAAVLRMLAEPVARDGYVEIEVSCTDDDGSVAAGPVEVSFVPPRSNA